MDPNQAPQPSGQFDPNQYDFITNPQQAPKKSLLPSVGGDKFGKIVLVVIVLGVITFGILIFGLLFGNRGDNRDQLLSLAREQSTVIAVADIGIEKAGSTDTKSLANSIKLTVQTDQNSLVAQLSKNGGKPKSKDIAGSVSSDVEQKLTVAEQNGTFDVAFESTIKEFLGKYQTNLKGVYDASKSKSAKEILSLSFDNTGLLIQDAENNK